MKGLRRTIIVVCFILLIPFFTSVITSIPEGKYYDSNLKDKVKRGLAEVIEVNKEMKIDKDTIFIQRVIRDENEIYLRYSVRQETGWSFSSNALVLYDDKGNKIHSTSGGSSGKLWGEDILTGYEKVSEDCKELTLKLEWFDRKDEIKIPLKEGGK